MNVENNITVEKLVRNALGPGFTTAREVDNADKKMKSKDYNKNLETNEEIKE